MTDRKNTHQSRRDGTLPQHSGTGVSAHRDFSESPDTNPAERIKADLFGWLGSSVDSAQPVPPSQPKQRVELTRDLLFEIASKHGWTVKGDHGQWIVCHTNAAANLENMMRAILRAIDDKYCANDQ